MHPAGDGGGGARTDGTRTHCQDSIGALPVHVHHVSALIHSFIINARAKYYITRAAAAAAGVDSREERGTASAQLSSHTHAESAPRINIQKEQTDERTNGGVGGSAKKNTARNVEIHLVA